MAKGMADSQGVPFIPFFLDKSLHAVYNKM